MPYHASNLHCLAGQASHRWQCAVDLWLVGGCGLAHVACGILELEMEAHSPQPGMAQPRRDSARCSAF